MSALQSISSTQMVTQVRSTDWNAKRPNIIANSDYFFCCPDSHHPQIKLCPSSFSDLNNTVETSGVLQWQLVWPFGLLETLINHFVVLYREKLFSRREDGHSIYLCRLQTHWTRWTRGASWGKVLLKVLFYELTSYCYWVEKNKSRHKSCWACTDWNAPVNVLNWSGSSLCYSYSLLVFPVAKV